jgi:hypothetical protein
MKGKINQFDPASFAGTIEGEDGRAYGFGQQDWQGWQPPGNNEEVRFEPNGAQATYIYAISGPIGAGFSGFQAAPPSVAAGLSLFKGRPQIFIALLALFVSCFVGAVRLPILGEGPTRVSFLGLPGVLGDLVEMGRAMGNFFGSLFGRQTQEMSGFEEFIQWFSLHLAWLVPISAAVLLGTNGPATARACQPRPAISSSLPGASALSSPCSLG